MLDKGIGDIAVYIYNLKNLPYTVKIKIKESTVTNNPPSKVTAHNGILSKNPQLFTASITDCGKDTPDA